MQQTLHTTLHCIECKKNSRAVRTVHQCLAAAFCAYPESSYFLLCTRASPVLICSSHILWPQSKTQPTPAPIYKNQNRVSPSANAGKPCPDWWCSDWRVRQRDPTRHCKTFPRGLRSGCCTGGKTCPKGRRAHRDWHALGSRHGDAMPMIPQCCYVRPSNRTNLLEIESEPLQTAD